MGLCMAREVSRARNTASAMWESRSVCNTSRSRRTTFICCSLIACIRVSCWVRYIKVAASKTSTAKGRYNCKNASAVRGGDMAFAWPECMKGPQGNAIF